MKIQVLIENKTERWNCAAEHGLSLFIESGGRRILFDAGQSAEFAENARKMGVDLSQADEAVISHGHYDHTGGIPEFCRINGKAKIYVHKDAFRETYGGSGDRVGSRPCGILWNEQEKKEIEPRLYLTNRLHWITEDIVVSGTVPTLSGTEKPAKFYIKESSDSYVPDSMNHEQILVIREKEGIYIFSGCSHRGIVSAIRYGRDIFPKEKVAGVIAGLHLLGADREAVGKIIDDLEKEEIGMIMPLHCTGIEAICEIKNRMKERCILASSGSIYEHI